jgi:chromosome segregation ATPase
MAEEPPKQSAAATVAENVRAIVEAAERSAAALEAEAREDAARIRAEAERQAETRLTRAQEAAARLAERAGELERQVAAVRASIAALVRELEELHDEPARSAAATQDPAAVAAVGEGEPVASVASADERDDVDEKIAEAEATAAREPDLADPVGSLGEGARVIALNMALRGTPRDETARYLAENFELDDPDALLDDVYARAGG